jgi:Sulfotransferase family
VRSWPRASAADVEAPHGRRLVFVGGLHRSGTSVLASCLGSHGAVSALTGTGVPEDEGQHLQDLIPPALALGGPGRFAFHPDAHLTERSPLATPASRYRLLRQWSRYWDHSKPVLVEKSPPNLTRMRLLQALFPEAYFVVIVRHPAVVTLATRKWTPAVPLQALLEHWFYAHHLLEQDIRHVDRLLILRYERLVSTPDAVLAELGEFLGLSGLSGAELGPGYSAGYERRWRRLLQDWTAGSLARYCRAREPAANHFGYSLYDLGHDEPWEPWSPSRSSSARRTVTTP